MSQIKFAKEPFSRELADEILDIAKEWWDEALSNQPLRVNVDIYEGLAQQGSLAIFTARNQQGKLVGYAVFIITVSTIGGQIMAYCESMVFRKEYRLGLTGFRFLRYIVDQLSGCDEITINTTVKRNLGPLFERAGFQHTGYIYRYGG